MSSQCESKYWCNTLPTRTRSSVQKRWKWNLPCSMVKYFLSQVNHNNICHGTNGNNQAYVIKCVDWCVVRHQCLTATWFEAKCSASFCSYHRCQSPEVPSLYCSQAPVSSAADVRQIILIFLVYSGYVYRRKSRSTSEQLWLIFLTPQSHFITIIATLALSLFNFIRSS